MNEQTIPTRFTNRVEASKQFGSHVDKLAPYLLRADPLADEVASAFGRLAPGIGRKMLDAALAGGVRSIAGAPQALRDLFAQLEDVPLWVDWDQLDVAGATHRRTGRTGGLVRACC